MTNFEMSPVTTEQRLTATAAELRGAHPWIPGATFIATPGLAEYLAAAVENFIPARLEYLRGEIEACRISYGEISELTDLAEHIDPGDTLLLQWAGVPEFPDTEDQEV